MEGSKFIKNPPVANLTSIIGAQKIFWDNKLHKCFIFRERGGHGVPRKLIYAAVIDARNVLCYRKDEDRPLGCAMKANLFDRNCCISAAML